MGSRDIDEFARERERERVQVVHQKFGVVVSIEILLAACNQDDPDSMRGSWILSCAQHFELTLQLALCSSHKHYVYRG